MRGDDASSIDGGKIERATTLDRVRDFNWTWAFTAGLRTEAGGHLAEQRPAKRCVGQVNNVG